MITSRFLRAHLLTNEISLPKAKLWRMDGDLRGEKITCLKGRIWITQQGDLNDYVLDAGESFWVSRPGAVVVQALEDTQIRFSRTASLGYAESVKNMTRA